MGQMSMHGAVQILRDGMQYPNVQYESTDETFHYLTADAPSIEGNEAVRYEFRVDRKEDEDENSFSICSRKTGTEDWHFSDTVVTN